MMEKLIQEEVNSRRSELKKELTQGGVYSRSKLTQGGVNSRRS